MANKLDWVVSLIHIWRSVLEALYGKYAKLSKNFKKKKELRTENG